MCQAWTSTAISQPRAAAEVSLTVPKGINTWFRVSVSALRCLRWIETNFCTGRPPGGV